MLERLELRERRARDERRHRVADVNVFRVESAQPYGWVVYLDGHAKTHFFASHTLALMYAREWAKANPPSVLVVVDLTERLTFLKLTLRRPYGSDEGFPLVCEGSPEVSAWDERWQDAEAYPPARLSSPACSA